MTFAGVRGKFWIVISDSRGMSPIPYQHPSRDGAFAEAERLTRLHGGQFYVFEAQGAARRVDVEIQRFDNDPPF